MANEKNPRGVAAPSGFDRHSSDGDVDAAYHAKDPPDNTAIAATRLGFTWTAFEAIKRPSFARPAGGEWVKKCRCGGEFVLFKDEDGNVRVGKWDFDRSCRAIEGIQQWLWEEGYQEAAIGGAP